MLTTIDDKWTGATRMALVERVKYAITHPSHGLVGLVDELLVSCLEIGLEMEWQAKGCRARFYFDDDSELHLNLPLRKSVLRAIIARVAELCQQQSRQSVSHYEGQTELTIPGDPERRLHVAYVNTPDVQQLKLAR